MAGQRHASRRTSDGADAAVTAGGRRRDAKNDARRAGARRNRALAGERHLSAFRVAAGVDAASLVGSIRASRIAAARVLRHRTRGDDRVARKRLKAEVPVGELKSCGGAWERYRALSSQSLRITT